MQCVRYWCSILNKTLKLSESRNSSREVKFKKNSFGNYPKVYILKEGRKDRAFLNTSLRIIYYPNNALNYTKYRIVKNTLKLKNLIRHSYLKDQLVHNYFKTSQTQ